MRVAGRGWAWQAEIGPEAIGPPTGGSRKGGAGADAATDGEKKDGKGSGKSNAVELFCRVEPLLIPIVQEGWEVAS